MVGRGDLLLVATSDRMMTSRAGRTMRRLGRGAANYVGATFGRARQPKEEPSRGRQASTGDLRGTEHRITVELGVHEGEFNRAEEVIMTGLWQVAR